MQTSKKNLLYPLCCACLSLLTGCYLGDPTAVRTTVSLALSQEGNTQPGSAQTAEAREALQLIHGLLTAHGFERSKRVQAENAPGLLASYGYFCGVLLDKGKLTVFFIDDHPARQSKQTKQASRALKRALSERFGATRVTLVH